MSALSALTRTQSRVFLREPLAVFFGLLFPAVLLVVIGVAIPGRPIRSPRSTGRLSSRCTRRRRSSWGWRPWPSSCFPWPSEETESAGSSAGCRRPGPSPNARGGPPRRAVGRGHRGRGRRRAGRNARVLRSDPRERRMVRRVVRLGRLLAARDRVADRIPGADSEHRAEHRDDPVLPAALLRRRYIPLEVMPDGVRTSAATRRPGPRCRLFGKLEG